MNNSELIDIDFGGSLKDLISDNEEEIKEQDKQRVMHSPQNEQ